VKLKRPPAAIVVLLAAGVTLFVLAGVASRRPPVTVTRTTAIALHDLASDDCNGGHVLKVSFSSQGRQVVADDQPPCGSGFVAGQRVTIFVSSANPLIIGPSEEWILDPSTHDPFDLIGPNGMPDFLTMLGVIATGVACILTVKRVRRRRDAPASTLTR